MRTSTLLFILAGLLAFLAVVLPPFFRNDHNQRVCQAKGGIAVTTYNNDVVCLSKVALVK